MKFMSLAIVAAVLCLAAADSSEVLDAEPNQLGIGGVISKKIKCAYNVVDEMIGQAELEQELKEFKYAMDKITRYNKECVKMAKGRIVALLKCEKESSIMFLKAVNTLNREVAAKGFDFAIDLNKAVLKCLVSKTKA